MFVEINFSNSAKCDGAASPLTNPGSAPGWEVNHARLTRGSGGRRSPAAAAAAAAAAVLGRVRRSARRLRRQLGRRRDGQFGSHVAWNYSGIAEGCNLDGCDSL